MNILFFTWKDLRHPLSGGAEVVNEEIASRLVRDGHNVILLVGGFRDCVPDEIINGYRVIRVGSRLTTYYYAYKYYKKNLSQWADLLIEEINTIPYFTQYYAKTKKRVLIIYQLAREVWFYEMRFPLNFVGYFLEYFYLRWIKNNKTITISNSTKNDLMQFGFAKDDIEIISMGTDILPLEAIENITKFNKKTIISIGRITSMKRTIDQIKAFEIAKRSIEELKLIIAGYGEGEYFEKVMRYISDSPYQTDITYLGKISKEAKLDHMRRSHLITVTSIKEGWGLIVTEAASQGTPAIVYDVDGLRDSVLDGINGLLCKSNKPEELGAHIVRLLNDQNLYYEFQKKGWEMSKNINFNQCYRDFKKAANIS